jgi:hypothetical protein
VKELGVNCKKTLIPIILIAIVLIIATVLVMGNSQESNSRPNSSVSTENQAVEIALPLAQAYVKRTDHHKDYSITTTKASLKETDRPYWFIEIELKIERHECYCRPATGYEVAVWADTGEIYHHGPIWNGDTPFKISVDKAIETALPLAQAYAQENNHTITTLTSSCYFDIRPGWDIIVNFEVIEKEKGESFGEQYGIGGYYVGIWADTGEIRTHSVINMA